MASQTCLNRMRKELVDLERDPPPLITCFPSDDNITELEAYLNGPPSTPYEKGIFRLDIHMPENYPFDPPMIRFRTPIYHPNIDECGRICASILKKGKDDQWKPSMNLRTTLLSLHSLIAEPNPDDPLDADIAKEYQQDYDLFMKKAREHTKKYAVDMPDHLIPDPYAESTTYVAKTKDKDLQNYDTGVVDDSITATSSKQKSKSKLSLSKKKQFDGQQFDSQSTTLPSSSNNDSLENDMKSKATKGSDTNALPTSQQKEEGTSALQQTDNDDTGSSSNKDDDGQIQQTLNKRDNELKDEKCDTQEYGSMNNATAKHENKSNDVKGNVMDQSELRKLEDESTNHEQHDALKQSNHDDELTNNDTKSDDEEVGSNNQHDSIGYETRIDNQKNEMKNNQDDITKRIINIDTDDETDDGEQLTYDKIAYISSDESDIVEQQPVIDVERGPNNKCDTMMEEGHKNDEMGEKSVNTADLFGPTLSPSSIGKTSEAPSRIDPNEMATPMETATVAHPLTPSTNTKPSPSSSTILINNDDSMDTDQSISALKTGTTDDAPNWTYTNFYSSHHLTFSTDDPFTKAFPAFKEERPIAPKRKSKISLSCKKKPKTA